MSENEAIKVFFHTKLNNVGKMIRVICQSIFITATRNCEDSDTNMINSKVTNYLSVMLYRGFGVEIL